MLLKEAVPSLGLAMIVKDVAKIIGGCLGSVRGVFDRVVIVDTGSTDDTKASIREVCPSAQILDFAGDKHPESFLLDAAETWNGEIPGPYTRKMMLADFSAARQMGWDAVGTDYVMWIDSDDVVEGSEHLRRVVEDMERDGVAMGMLRYDYAHDAKGRPTSTLLRERIAATARLPGAKWNLPVHEVFGPYSAERFYEEVKVVHRQGALMHGHKVNLRNVKLLAHWWKTRDVTKDDARMLFYMARDARGIWPDKCLGWFREYCRRSGWDEERAQAHVFAGKIWEEKFLNGGGSDCLEDARSEYAQAHIEAASKPDPFFALARVAHHKNDWAKCVEWSERGFAASDATGAGGPSMTEHDPQARAVDARLYYAGALTRIGRHTDAIAACVAGLDAEPADHDARAQLVGIKEWAEKALAGVEDSAGPTETRLYSVPGFLSSGLEDPPVDIPKPLLTAFAVHLWKLHMAGGRRVEALTFLSALPMGLDDMKVAEARRLTEKGVSAPGPVSKDGPRGRLKICIWTGEAWERWTPRSLASGIGGSETAAVNVARELALYGHEVTVVSDCPAGECTDGVEYVPWRDVVEGRRLLEGDIAVVSRQPSAIEYVGRFAKKLLWVHDIHVGPNTPTIRGFIERYDRVLALSRWHKEFLLAAYPFLRESSVVVTRNGIDPSRFMTMLGKNENRLIWSSSWDRGLRHLLAVMPEIRKRVPDVVLHVYYGSKLWKDLRPDQATEIAAIEGLLAEGARAGWAIDHGRVGQDELAEAFVHSKVWAYFTDFHETSCISAMEAQAAGAVPVTMRLAALPETVKHGLILDGDPNDPEVRRKYADEVVTLLEDEGMRRAIAYAGRRHALANLTWAGVAIEWDGLFRKMLELPSPSPAPSPAPSPVSSPAPPSLRDQGLIQDLEKILSEDPLPIAHHTFEVLSRRHRVALIMGRLSASVHGIYDADTLYDEGMMTGTGSSFFNIARGLAERGHQVDVFCQAKRHYLSAPKLAGANVYNIDEPGLEVDTTYDAYVSINEPDMLRSTPPDRLRICAMWLNDWSYTAQGFDAFVDLYACPSWTHARYLHETTRVPREKLVVINLATNFELFRQKDWRLESLPVGVRPIPRVAWCSSPDRGLHHLLSFWPSVRSRVRNAELHIYYRFKPWFDFMTTDAVQKETIWGKRALVIGEHLDRLGRSGEQGVYLVDSIPPARMANELCKTQVLAYPCDPTRFTEGFSCAVLDACAAGCVPIVSAVDALPEIYGGVAHMIPAPPEEHASEWVDSIVRGLTDDHYAAVIGGAARALASRHTRQVMAADWERLIERARKS
jgi:glycosyltransferase involved in cell wall biosynthesis